MSDPAPPESQLLTDLRAKSSAIRKRAAKALQKTKSVGNGSFIYEAYLNERLDSRTWETQVEMVRALGLSDYKAAKGSIKEVVVANEEHSMLATVCATAYCRLARASIEDVEPILKLLLFARFSVAAGAFLALGCDKMMPDEKSLHTILDYARRFGYIKGYGDPRYGVAVASGGWVGSNVTEFLADCLLSQDTGVAEAAASSLKGKYIKCR